jgi:ketosteroid isomerase-like protein
MADNGAAIVALDRKRMEATVKQDFAALDAIIGDDLIYTHSTARIDTKESLIGNMKSGKTVYTGLEATDVVAQDLGSAVILTGVARVNVTSNGNPVSFGIRYVNVYANRGGEWKMVTWQSTKTPD